MSWDSEEDTEAESPCNVASAATGQNIGRRINGSRAGDLEQGCSILYVEKFSVLMPARDN